MIENRPDLLREMMDDLNQAPEEFRPGNFWAYHIPRIYKSMHKLDLNNFRGEILAPGSISSFGGGADDGIDLGWKIHPFSPLFRKFDESLIVKAYNRLINKFAAIIPIAGFLSVRSSLARRYYGKAFKTIQKNAYTIALLNDHNKVLKNIEDSPEGNAQLFSINGKHYTLLFLDKVIEYNFISRHVDFTKTQMVLEIGSGIGMQAAVLLKAHPHLKICLVDIPPALYVAQQYLSTLFPGEVLTYQESKKLNTIGPEILKKYKVVCLGAWFFDKLQDAMFDLFINSTSFQEMEPWLVENYLKHVKRCTKDWVYLQNNPEGRHTAKKGKFGLLEKTERHHYLQCLRPEFSLIEEAPAIMTRGQSAEKRMMFKSTK